MVLWRISRHRDLKGIGGLKAGGRWHYPGQPVVYLSENPASALLEVCVHTAANDVPPEFTLLKIPSAIVPQTANFLFNPLHANASLFHIAEALKYPFDFRIKR